MPSPNRVVVVLLEMSFLIQSRGKIGGQSVHQACVGTVDPKNRIFLEFRVFYGIPGGVVWLNTVQ